MDCNQIRELTSEYLDRSLSPEATVAAEKHWEECSPCRKQREQLQRIRRECGALSETPAPKNSWNLLRLRLQAEGLLRQEKEDPFVEALSPLLGDRLLRQMVFYRRLAFGSLAACLVMAGFDVGAFWMLSRQTQPSAGVSLRQLEVQVAVLQLEKAITKVSVALDRSKIQWSPEVRQTVEINLAALDQAINDSRRALVENPGNDEAGTFLLQACQKKLSLLHSVIDMDGI